MWHNFCADNNLCLFFPQRVKFVKAIKLSAAEAYSKKKKSRLPRGAKTFAHDRRKRQMANMASDTKLLNGTVYFG